MDAVRELLKKLARRKVPKDAETGLPKKYVSGLTPAEKKEQVKAIKKTSEVFKKTGKVLERPGMAKSGRRSPHVIKFENKYGFSVTDIERVKKEFPGTDVDKILAKGRAAFASGSRPGQNIAAWSNARLASVLTGGKSLAVDKDLVSDADLKKILG